MSKYLRIVVSVALLTLIAWRTNWSEVGGKFANLPLTMWFAAVGLYILAQIASARRWQLFARPLHFEHSLSQYCAYYFIGMYFNLLLPTSVGGDVMRVWYLSGDTSRRRAAFASVFLERVNGLLVLIVMACGAVLLSPVEMPWWMTASVWSIAGCSLLGLAAVPVLRHWQKIPLGHRQRMQMFLDLMRPSRMFFEATLMSVVTQGAGILLIWCLAVGLGLKVPLAYCCIMVSLVSLLIMLPVSVNGMGVREGGTVLFLTPLGVDEATALSLAFLWFTAGAAVSLMGGVIYLGGSYSRVEPAPS